MIKHLAAIILAMAFAVQAFATDRYLSPTGTNSGAGGSGAPWLTLTYAIANADTGDTIYVNPGTYTGETQIVISTTTAASKVLTIQPVSTTPVFTLSTTADCWTTSGGATFSGASISVTGIAFSATGAATGYVKNINAGTWMLAFTNCSFDSTSHDRRIYGSHSAVTDALFTLRFTGCTIDCSAVAGTYACNLTASVLAELTFDQCTLKASTDIFIIIGTAAGTCPLFQFTNNSVDATYFSASGACVVTTNQVAATLITKAVVSGNTITANKSAIRMEQSIQHLIVENNIITGTGSNLLLLACGSDSNETGANISYLRMIGNDCRYPTPATGSHGVFVGRFVQAGIVAYNKSSNPDYGIVVKGCTKVIVAHNVATECYRGCIYVRGAQDCIINNNSARRTASGHGSEYFGIMVDSIDDSGVYTDPARNSFFYNIVYVPAGVAGYGIYENTTSHVGTTSIATHTFNYNIIVAGSDGYARFNGTTYATSALAAAAWPAYGTVSEDNFANDITSDPLFVSTTDLQLRTNSPGQPTAARLNNPYGAYGPQLGGYYGGN